MSTSEIIFDMEHKDLELCQSVNDIPVSRLDRPSIPEYRARLSINDIFDGPRVPKHIDLESARMFDGSVSPVFQVGYDILDLNSDYMVRTPQRANESRDAFAVRSLIQDDFDFLKSISDSHPSLDNCLKKAGSSLSVLQDISEANSTGYVNILEKFEKFKALDRSFSGELSELFPKVYEKQDTMSKKLETQKGEVDKKLKSIKTWRRSSNVFFFGTFSIVLIGSVVAAVVAAPPIVTASASVATVPLGSMWKWVNSWWKKYEHKSTDQREMISAMQVGNRIVIDDLDNTKALVDKLGADMEGILRIVDFVSREEEQEAVGLVVDEMKNTMNVFAKTIEDLSDCSEKCKRDVRIARTMILKRIIKHLNDSL